MTGIEMERLRIIVLGYIVRCPLGGMAWHYLHYLLGFLQLQHDTYFLEDSEDYPSCYDPTRHVTDVDCTYGLSFMHKTCQAVGVAERWGYYDAHQGTWHGPLSNKATDICKTADVLVNISGSNPIRNWMKEIPVRIFVDTDPGFEQIRQLTVPRRRILAQQHTSYFTFGENIAHGTSFVPDDGISWQATRQPIVLSAWPVSPPVRRGQLTTIMQWDSYPAREYGGVTFGLKGQSFMEYLTLPQQLTSWFELALGSASAPREQLAQHGWNIRNPLEITKTVGSFQKYIRASKAEFTVAKHGYVEGHTGWFSERSANYLAAGRPVVTQDTGFTDWLSCEGGILPFSNMDEAIVQVEDLNARYDYHCRKAREVVADYFDSQTVLQSLLDSALS